jgi:hypothetical protein
MKTNSLHAGRLREFRIFRRKSAVFERNRPDTKQTGKRNAGKPHAAFDLPSAESVTLFHTDIAVHIDDQRVLLDKHRMNLEPIEGDFVAGGGG